MWHVHETHIPYKNITDVKMTKVKTLQWPQICTLPHFILYVHINQALPSHYRLEDTVEAGECKCKQCWHGWYWQVPNYKFPITRQSHSYSSQLGSNIGRHYVEQSSQPSCPNHWSRVSRCQKGKPSIMNEYNSHWILKGNQANAARYNYCRSRSFSRPWCVYH